MRCNRSVIIAVYAVLLVRRKGPPSPRIQAVLYLLSHKEIKEESQREPDSGMRTREEGPKKRKRSGSGDIVRGDR